MIAGVRRVGCERGRKGEVMAAEEASVDRPPAPLGSWDELPDGLLVADEQRRVVVFNRAAERVTGLHRADVLGKDLADALPLEHLDGQRWWVGTEAYERLGIRRGHPERPLLLHGHRQVLVTARYTRSPGAGGTAGPVQGLVVGLRDAEAAARQERRNADLVSTVAHELRSPLTSVKGFTATLLAKWERFTDAQRRLMLETVNNDADRLTRLIAELLDIARIDSGRLELRRQVVDIPAAVHRVVDRHLAGGEPPERFAVLTRGPLPEVWADPDKLEQVLGNLVENAVRHGSGLVTVQVLPAPEDPTGVEVTVTDEGEGIPEEQMGRVFTRFWRGGRRGGTGLGLYIVRGLVEAHGGGIEVRRAPSGGALFRFTLPGSVPDFRTPPDPR